MDFKKSCSRGQIFLAIILSPTLLKYYKLSCSLPSVVPQDNDIAVGRFINIKMNFKVKVKIKIPSEKTK